MCSPGRAWQTSRKNTTTNPRKGPALVVLSGPNRVLIARSQPHHTVVPATPGGVAVLDAVAVAGTDWPVSPPSSNPGPTRADRGLLDRFPGQDAP